jgi:hypothetical protein
MPLMAAILIVFYGIGKDIIFAYPFRCLDSLLGYNYGETEM